MGPFHRQPQLLTTDLKLIRWIGKTPKVNMRGKVNQSLLESVSIYESFASLTLHIIPIRVMTTLQKRKTGKGPSGSPQRKKHGVEPKALLNFGCFADFQSSSAMRGSFSFGPHF